MYLASYGYSLSSMFLLEFRDFRDIDLFSGAMTELPLEGAIVGPTFACLIARQFVLYKIGDRFWYENSHRQGLTEGG